MGIVERKTRFITIRSEGFYLNKAMEKELVITVIKEQAARKYRDVQNGKRFLSCFSSNGRVSNHGKVCCDCRNIKKCHKKMRIYFFDGDYLWCLELPATSYENYLDYKRDLARKDLVVEKISRKLTVIDRGYWGEVSFRRVYSTHTPAICRKKSLGECETLHPSKKNYFIAIQTYQIIITPADVREAVLHLCSNVKYKILEVHFILPAFHLLSALFSEWYDRLHCQFSESNGFYLQF